MGKKKSDETDLTALVEHLARQSERDHSFMGSPKNVNYLVLGVMAAAAALVWNTVITAPANFGQLSQQNAEIRTTMIEMKSSVSALSTKFDEAQKTASDQKARLSTLESQAVATQGHIKDLNERLTELERKR